MKYIAVRGFHHDKLGKIDKGQIFEASDCNLSPVRRFIEEHETTAHPGEAAGGKSSVSPAARVSRKPTQRRSRRGATVEIVEGS